ncbi:DUF4083 family protein [Sporosarcina sp. E16_8]|uniref:DUF4083 family protein n=1 Tax=Sporosarcina sp. E16_8 TaxID=2789295 RepID=UPI001A91491F|nr:DUF4083 family protein [Sporosarcina sp. E16_8]MBO0586337.1 DUF4083 family protein [Sporosarcina sp. E16_8]
MKKMYKVNHVENMNNVNMGGILVTSTFILFVSLAVSIRKWSNNEKKKTQYCININRKLDKIIVLLETKDSGR